MSKNGLNHNTKLAKLRSDATYARSEKRHVHNTKRSRITSKRYNKAVRKAAKEQLKKVAR